MSTSIVVMLYIFVICPCLALVGAQHELATDLPNLDATSLRDVQRTVTRRVMVTADVKQVRAYTGTQLLSAILRPVVADILISTPKFSFDVNITEIAAKYGIVLPLPLSRNLTIRGDPDLPFWPVVHLGYSKGLIRLEHGITLAMYDLVFTGLRGDSFLRAPGLDIISPSREGGYAYVQAGPGIVVAAMCYDDASSKAILKDIRQPPDAPPFDIEFSVPQDGCTYDTSRPYEERCWAERNDVRSFHVYGADEDPVTGQLTPNNLIIRARGSLVCERVMTDECIQRNGSPYFCMREMLREDRTPATAQVHQTSEAGVATPVQQAQPSSSGSNAALIAGVVCGCCAALVIAGVVVLVVLKRRRWRQRQKTYAANPLVLGDQGASTETSPQNKTYRSGENAVSCSDVHQSQLETAFSVDVLTPGDPMPTGPALSVPLEKCVVTGVAHPRRSLTAIVEAGGEGLSKKIKSTKSQDNALVTTRMPTRPDLQLNITIEEGWPLPDGDPAPETPEREDAGEHSKPLPACDLHSDSYAIRTAGSGGQAATVHLLPVVRGKGSFGRVVEGMYGGQRVAVKMMGELHNWSAQSELLVESFQYEVQVLGRCQHPNIVRLLAACVTPPRLCLVLELMDASLEKVMYGNPLGKVLMPMPKVFHIGIGVCRALAYMHPTIVHRDLKPANVLVNDPWSDQPVVKLTDFGLSRLRDTVVPTKHPDAGTPAYMAPECFDVNNKLITHKADIYALGVLLWEMIAGEAPWAGYGNVAIAVKVTYYGKRLRLDHLRAERLPHSLALLLQECWDVDPERRPAADEVGKTLTVALQKYKAWEGQYED